MRCARGAPCDVLIVTAAMIDSLLASGEVRAGSAAPIGRVADGARRARGATTPSVDGPEALKTALAAASALYFPDAALSTAGAHVAVGARSARHPRGARAASAHVRQRQDGDARARRCRRRAGDRLHPGDRDSSPRQASPGRRVAGTVRACDRLRRSRRAGAAGDELPRRFITALAGAESLALASRRRIRSDVGSVERAVAAADAVAAGTGERERKGGEQVERLDSSA